MTKILLVDDDKTLLKSLKRRIQAEHPDWEIFLAANAESALKTLASKKIDVAVVDIMLPGMNGKELLQNISSNYPETLKIIFSGETLPEDRILLANLAEQFFPKPAQPGSLVNALFQLIKLTQKLGFESFKAFLKKIKKLPTPYKLYYEIKGILASNTSTLEEISSVIQKDIALSSRILQMANSAFYTSNPQKVTTLKEALKVLGINIIHDLVFVTHCMNILEEAIGKDFPLPKIWDHSFQVAANAKLLTLHYTNDYSMGEQSFIAGTLHDIGKLLFCLHQPDKYRELQNQSNLDKPPLYKLEEASFGINHAELGSFLLGSWGIPDEINKAVAFHHSPSLSTLTSFSPLTAVHIANYLVNSKDGVATVDLDINHLTSLNLQDDFELWNKLLFTT